MAFDPIIPPVGLNQNLLWKAEAASAKAENKPAVSFGTVLAQSIAEVESSGKIADQAADRFLSGENQDLHDVAIASQKAELTMDLFLQSRNKIVSAYQEIMRMQI